MAPAPPDGGVVVGAVGDVEGSPPPVLAPREDLLREGQVQPEGVVGHGAAQQEAEGGEVVGGVAVVVGHHRADRYVAAAGGRRPDGLEGVCAGVGALLPEAPPAAVDAGLVQSDGAVEGGREEDAAVLNFELKEKKDTSIEELCLCMY